MSIRLKPPTQIAKFKILMPKAMSVMYVKEITRI
jgi:hypothetical protein